MLRWFNRLRNTKVDSILSKVLLLALVLTLLLGTTSLTTSSQAETQTDPIRIGIVGPMTGWAYVYGQYVVDGAKFALDKFGGKWHDRPIKLFIEDTKGKSDKTIEILNRFKTQNKVHVVIGPSLGNEGVTTAEWAKHNPGLPILIGYSAPEDVTMRKHSHNVLRPGWTGSQVIFHFGRFCAKELGYKRIIMVGQDYAYPWGQIAGFIRGFLENGGLEVKRIWHPVEQVDFGSIMTQLQALSGQYDAVIYNGSGAQSIAFFKQWVQYGMDSYYPQLLGGANVTDPSTLPELGPEAEGIYSSMHYVAGLQNKYNLEFRKEFYEKYDRYPGAIEVQGYDAMRVIFKALDAVDGNIGPGGGKGTDAFIDALYKVKMPHSPKGPWYFDKFGQAVQNIYIQKVKKVNGQLMNVPIRTYVEVSQFGPYAALGMEEQYMSQPPNTRSFPPGTRDEYFKMLKKYFGKEYVKKLEEHGGWWGPAAKYVEGEYIPEANK